KIRAAFAARMAALLAVVRSGPFPPPDPGGGGRAPSLLWRHRAGERRAASAVDWGVTAMSPKCKVQSAKCKVQSPKCKVQSPKCKVQSAKSWGRGFKKFFCVLCSLFAVTCTLFSVTFLSACGRKTPVRPPELVAPEPIDDLNLEVEGKGI